MRLVAGECGNGWGCDAPRMVTLGYKGRAGERLRVLPRGRGEKGISRQV